MSVSSMMENLADKVRALSGSTSKMSLTQMAAEVDEANDEISAQSSLIAQVKTALTGKAVGGGGSSGPIYGRAVFFGDGIGLGYDENNYGFIDMIAESGAFESVIKHCSAESEFAFANFGQISTYIDDVRNSDIVFLEYLAVVDALYGSMSLSDTTLGFADGVTSNGQAMCDVLKYVMVLIREANPTAKVVWLAPFRWRGYSTHYPPILFSGGDDAAINDWMEQKAEYELLNDALLLLEATYYRVIKNYGGSVISLGLPIEMMESESGLTVEHHRQMAQTVIADPFRDDPLPTLHRTLTVFQQEADSQAILGADCAMIKHMAVAGGIRLELEVAPIGEESDKQLLPKFTYNALSLSDEALVFTTFTGAKMYVAHAKVFDPDAQQTGGIPIEITEKTIASEVSTDV